MIIKELDELEKLVGDTDAYDDESREMVKNWKVAISEQSELLSVEQLGGFKILITKLKKDIDNINQRLLYDIDLTEIDRKVIMQVRSEKDLFIKMFSGINEKLNSFAEQIKNYYESTKQE